MHHNCITELHNSNQLLIHMNKHIELAIDNFRKLAGKYSRAERYYRGDHDLSFATEKFQNAFGLLFREFAMNLCPAIVDAVKAKLIVIGVEEGRNPTVMERAGHSEEGTLHNCRVSAMRRF